MTRSRLKAICDAAYAEYNHACFISPDPLELVLPYASIPDREIAGFIAAALATGRVGSIVATGRALLERLGAPYDAVSAGERALSAVCRGFTYRFFTAKHLFGMLLGLRRVVAEHGSLERCFATGAANAVDSARGDGRAIAGLSYLASCVIAHSGGRLAGSILVSRPELKSACKRLLLFLRWMVRHDEVDPGGWSVLEPSELLVPMDTHMLAVSRQLGLTTRRQANLSVSIEVTRRFAGIGPDDPVRYDFSLTRYGIHPQVRQRPLTSREPSRR